MPQAAVAPPEEPDTKERLLEAALGLFSAHGFDGVTTRQLAAEAGANIAAIAYHFGGKQELYNALLERIVAETAPRFEPLIARLHADLDAGAADRDTLAAIAAAFTGALVQGFLGDERMRLRAGVVLREHAHPSDAFPILYRGRLEPMLVAITRLVAAATAKPETAPETLLRAQAVLGQILIFVLGREVVFRRLGWEAYTPDRIALVGRTVTASVLASLGLSTPETSS